MRNKLLICFFRIALVSSTKFSPLSWTSLATNLSFMVITYYFYLAFFSRGPKSFFRLVVLVASLAVRSLTTGSDYGIYTNSECGRRTHTSCWNIFSGMPIESLILFHSSPDERKLWLTGGHRKCIWIRRLHVVVGQPGLRSHMNHSMGISAIWQETN